MNVQKVLKIAGITMLVLVLGFIAREYWRHLNYTQTYDACVQNFGSVEIAPDIHRCKVPFLNREFFFDERSVETDPFQ